MQEHRHAVTVWSGALLACALTVAGIARQVTWLFALALVAAGLFFIVLLVSGVPDLTGWFRQQTKSTQAPLVELPPEKTPVFTERWRHTTAGGDVPALMRALQKSLPHPGYMRRTPGSQPPVVRVATLVACDPLGDGPTTSGLRGAFLRFLRRPPIWSLIEQLTDPPVQVSWRSYASNGRINNGAVLLRSDDDEMAPIASAILNLNEVGTALWVHAPWAAELVIYVEPRDKRGEPARPVGLSEWHDRLLVALGSRMPSPSSSSKISAWKHTEIRRPSSVCGSRPTQTWLGS